MSWAGLYAKRCFSFVIHSPKRSSCLTCHQLTVNSLSHRRPRWSNIDRPLSIQCTAFSSAVSSAATPPDHSGERSRQHHHRHQPSRSPLLERFTSFVDGPSLQLGTGKLAYQTNASVVATAGSTVVLATLTVNSLSTMTNSLYASPMTTPIASSSSSSSSSLSGRSSSSSNFTVEYRQRHHGVGQIPPNAARRDQARLTTAEIVASRAIDRALRPLLSARLKDVVEPLHYHVQCSVQSCPLWPENDDDDNDSATFLTGHPVALALNAAAAVLMDYLSEPVAATSLAVWPDGTLVQDPLLGSLASSSRPCVGQLLYAGTRDEALMLEWTSHTAVLPEKLWGDLLPLAQASLQPILDTQLELQALRRPTGSHGLPSTLPGLRMSAEEETLLRASLGLPPQPQQQPSSSSKRLRRKEPWARLPAHDWDRRRKRRQERLQATTTYVQERLGDAAKRLFGYNQMPSSTEAGTDRTLDQAFIHRDQNLLPKTIRGKRETLIRQEIFRLVEEYLDREDDSNTSTPLNGEDVQQDVNDDDVSWIQREVASKIMRHAMWEASLMCGTRADGRGAPGQGWKTIRPIRLDVPALPDTVHGSALFSRGDTQVLCTVTLGPPKDGERQVDPYEPTGVNPRAVPEPPLHPGSYYDALPVGSLRFLRTQEATVSDLNSRKVKAERERTGESGMLAEVKRAFFQYDFPAYSTGDLPTGSMAHNRRAIGHGVLAERACQCIFPPPHVFPYSIRLTSEVTDSNGSSSMASVCGASLALLDAGVPITDPVAGVSVGLALSQDVGMDDSDKQKHSLLLDITGTEDHFGYMDFKVAGTRDGVSAAQLDVKEPIPIYLLVDAIKVAQAGRVALLDEMNKQLVSILGGLKHRSELKDSAPRVEVVRFDPQRKRDLIGPGGIVMRQIEDRYGVSLDLTQEGQCLLFGANRDMVLKAKSTVMDLVADVLEGETYSGTIIEVKDFGAIVELLRNKEGILHVSELADDDSLRKHPEGAYGYAREQLRVGQKIDVLCIGVDPVQGSIKLSRKAMQKS